MEVGKSPSARRAGPRSVPPYGPGAVAGLAGLLLSLPEGIMHVGLDCLEGNSSVASDMYRNTECASVQLGPSMEFNFSVPTQCVISQSAKLKMTAKLPPALAHFIPKHTTEACCIIFWINWKFREKDMNYHFCIPIYIMLYYVQIMTFYLFFFFRQ